MTLRNVAELKKNQMEEVYVIPLHMVQKTGKAKEYIIWSYMCMQQKYKNKQDYDVKVISGFCFCWGFGSCRGHRAKCPFCSPACVLAAGVWAGPAFLPLFLQPLFFSGWGLNPEPSPWATCTVLFIFKFEKQSYLVIKLPSLDFHSPHSCVNLPKLGLEVLTITSGSFSTLVLMPSKAFNISKALWNNGISAPREDGLF